MAILTTDPHAWFTCVDKKGKKQIICNSWEPGQNYPFGFECNFSDTPTPPVNTVTLYNVSKQHLAFYRNGEKCYMEFNWGKEHKILSEGYITKMDRTTHDGTTDTTQITFTEGTSYANVAARKLKVSKKKKVSRYTHKKVRGKNGKIKTKRVKHRVTKTTMINKTYRRGTSYKSLIRGIAKQAKIKISKIDLHKNPRIKKSYTAKGKPLTLLKQLVKKTGSVMTYVRGQLQIVDPKSKKRTWYSIDEQDLLEQPAYSSDSKNSTLEITIPLVPEITVNVGIKLHTKYYKGNYYVKSGKHSFDGEKPLTQCSLAPMGK